MSRIPVKMGDFSVIDSEFGSVREKFDSEMRKMEDEMNKFREDLLQKDSFRRAINNSSSDVKNEVRSSSTSRFKRRRFVDGKEVYTEESSKDFSSADASDLMTGSSGLGRHENWLANLDSPLIRQVNQSNQSNQQLQQNPLKELKLRFDVSQYSPEEIMVKTVDNKLLVHAKHEEKTEGRTSYREYNREFLLPAGTDPDLIKSSLSKDGILTVEAPLPQPSLTHQE